MTYNREIHDRRSIRLKGYDYSQEGAYFITICTYKKEHRFGYIHKGKMHHNEYGVVAEKNWAKLSSRFVDVEPGIFVVMPNHVHGILLIATEQERPEGIAPTIGDIVGAYKSQVAVDCLKIYDAKGQNMGKLWQRNYYEHIIRNEHSLNIISDYIANNVATWEDDILYQR